MIWEAITSILRSSPPANRLLCVLPKPAVRVAKGTAKKPVASIYEIDPERKHYGFHLESRETEREGAERWLTGLDRAELEQRSLGGGKKVIAENEKAKAAWAGGDTVVECAKTLRLSESWVEKRFAAFSAALSTERSQK